MKTPFTKAWVQQRSGSIEFADFRKEFERDITQITPTIPRYADLDHYYKGYVEPNGHDGQFSFGNRLMMARDLQGKPTLERGGSLLYSFGPTGLVVVILYPAQSDIARVEESVIILSKGLMSKHQLRSRLRRDLRDLVAYTYVSSIEAEATTSEHLRVWWLRFMREKHVGDEAIPAFGGRIFRTALSASSKSILQSLSTGFGRQITTIIVVWLLFRYAPSLVSWIAPGAVTSAHLRCR